VSEAADDRHIFLAPWPVRYRDRSSPNSMSRSQCTLSTPQSAGGCGSLFDVGGRRRDEVAGVESGAVGISARLSTRDERLDVGEARLTRIASP
jgi:hypothetical protein